MMSGDHLRLGDVDGNGVIYSSEGELIPQKGERLLGRFSNVPLEVTKSWRTWMVKSILARPAGHVVCFLTDRRIVFVRCPDSFKAGSYLMTPYGAAEGIAKMNKAREILRAGGFEYCEVISDDVRFYRRCRTGVDLLLMSRGEKYNAFLITKAVSSDFHSAVMSWLEAKGVSQK